MAKAVKIVGTVVAVVAIVATAGAALAPVLAGTAGTAAAASATIAGVSAATLGTIGAVASAVGGALAVVSALAFKPKFSQEGSATKFVTNPQSGIPYAIGRTRMSGLRIHADTWEAYKMDSKHEILGFGVLLSGGGQIDAIEDFTADGDSIAFNPTTGNATTYGYTDWMAQKVHLGGPQTSALALSVNGVAFPGWTSAHKLSGMTHALWALRYDPDGKKYGAGVPEPAWIGRWVRVYDPRLDSTYPGGSGACRALDESTYVWSRTPGLHALTWAMGRWQNGKKTFGIGAPLATIRFADFVEAANIAEANNWYCGGVEYSTDSKWDVFKRILQAGGSVPTMTGAMIGCRTYTPRVSVTTIGSDDLLNGLSFSATKPQRDRFNTVIPRYRSEEHEWEVISGTPVSNATYVAADGRVRQKEYDLPLVQNEVGQPDVDGNRQAGQLAAYEIVESREAGPISFSTGPKYLGLKSGDCITLNVPDEGFVDTKIMIIEPPKFDPVSGVISFLGQTETDAKHTFALGQTTTPPPPYALVAPDIAPTAPDALDWTVTAGLNGEGIPVLHVVGGSATGTYWSGIVVQYKRVADTDWIEYNAYRDTTNLDVEILADGETEYQVRIAYLGASNIVSDWLTPASVTTPAATLSINNASVFLYQRTDTDVAPAVPSTTSTYDFTTGVLTGFNNGWSTSLPTTGGAYRWMIRATAISNGSSDTILTSEWSTPAVFSENGTNGTNVATVYLYRRSATSPTVPTGTFTFTFATGVLSGGTFNSWTQAIPANNGLPLWVIGAVASSNTATDTIAATEFTAPVTDSGAGLNNATVRLYQRATSAPAVPSLTSTYTFSTGVLTGAGLGSWTQTVPTGTDPLYTTQAVAIGAGTTDTIANTEWSSVTIMVENGATGAAGTNVATVYLYRRSAASPTIPSGTFTYTFATGVLSGGTLNGWTQAVPANNGLPLWVIGAVASANTATDTIAAAEFTTPVIDSGAGLNSATVRLYQRATSTPAVPSTTTTYTFATGVLSGTLGSWTQTVPAGTNPLYTTQAVAISADLTDDVLAAEWSSATVMVENGAVGAAGLNNAIVYLYKRGATSPTIPSGTFTYTFATGVLSGGTLNGWTQDIPAADGNPLWVIGATASANTATDTIAAAEFTTPVIDSGAGLNNATIFIYQRATSAPAVPSGDLTYTFATGVLSGASLGSWTQTVPSGTNPLYITTATAISTGTTDIIPTGEWAAVKVLAENGAAGANNATVYLYKRGATSPAVPTGTFTYTFATGVLSGGTLNGWTQDIPAADGNPLWVIGAVASANTATDSIAATEFTTPVIDTGAGLNNATVRLYQRAATAPAVPSTSTTYTFSTGVLSGTLGSWTQTVPSGTNPLYTTQAVAISADVTDTILTAEWSSPTIMVENGSNNATVYLFKRSATTPTLLPTGTFTYTFATGVLSGGTLNGWTQGVPAADSNSLYVISAVASSNAATDGIAAAEFTSPVIYNNDTLAYTTATNFNARNDRNSAAITAPTIATDGTAVDHTLNTDGSADVSLEWAWSGTNSDIDSWQIMVVSQSTSGAYTVGSTPAIETHYYVPPDRRAFFLKGVSANSYWTFAVRAVRVVDPDINATGYIYSSWVQPTLAAEAPYRPTANVAFTGDISGTVGYAPLPMQASYTIQNYRSPVGASIGGRTKTIKLVRYKGDTDVSSSATWAVDNTYGGLSGTVDTTGLVTLTFNSSHDGFIVVTSTYEGIGIRHIVTSESVWGPPAPTAGHTIMVAPGLGVSGLVSTTEVDVSDIFVGKTGPSGAIDVKCYFGFIADSSPGGSAFNPQTFIYRRPVGGTFTQVAATNNGNANTYYDLCSVVKLASCNGAFTGLTANTEYEFKFTAKRLAGSISGTLFTKACWTDGY